MDGKIFLYGPPGSGKTTLGEILAGRLSVPFRDLDREIEKRAGKTVPEIFASDGEAAFRALERRTLAEIAASAPENSVVSLGGGTLLDPESRAVAEASGEVFCLDADEKELQRRIDASPGSRPLGNRLRERAAHYASFPRRIAAFFRLPDSLVAVGTGVRSIVRRASRKSLTVTDANLARLYGGELGGAFAVPAGEETKNIETVADIWNAFLRAGLGRDGLAVAFGGGVAGDMTGFAAATWMRGIPWMNVPSSLLAMVDSSTGGKTGCDLPGGKNMVGAFHSPLVVAADTDVLATLPAREWRCGLAEAVKHAVIADPGLADSLGIFSGLKDAPDGEPFAPACTPGELAAFVARALAVKVKIVEEDPFEKTGARAKLNLGHTVGHALEIASGFKIEHGEAVSIGTVEEARIAVRMGLAEKSLPDTIAGLFASAGLPVSMPDGATAESLAPLMARDKKNAGGRIRCALPFAMGDVRLTDVVV